MVTRPGESPEVADSAGHGGRGTAGGGQEPGAGPGTGGEPDEGRVGRRWADRAAGSRAGGPLGAGATTERQAPATGRGPAVAGGMLEPVAGRDRRTDDRAGRGADRVVGLEQSSRGAG